jgi:flagellar protein FliO/FliZ
VGGEELKHFYLTLAIFLIITNTSVLLFAQDASQDTAAAGAMSSQDIAVPADGVVSQTASEETLLRNREAERALPLGDEVAALSGGSTASVFTLLRMLLVLAVVAVAIYGVVVFMKRISRPPQQRNPYLKVLARVPLGAGTVAVVVSVGSKAWLVGAGDNSVSLLSEITDQELIDTMLLDESQKGVENGGKFADFGALLRRVSGGTATGGNAADGAASAFDSSLRPDNVRKRRERLKGL